MFTATTSLPYSFFSLLVDKESIINELYSYRTDKLVSDYYGEDFMKELMCNEASNVSPLSAESGTHYLLPSELFAKYFQGV